MSNLQRLNQGNYNYWYNLVYAYFYRRISSKLDVEDLTSETLTDFFIYEKLIEDEKRFIWGIARNKLKSFYYKKTKNPLSNEHIEQLEISYSPHYQNKMEQILLCAKNQLAEVDFAIVEMSVLCDFDSKRIADELQLKPDNIRQKLSRSLKKLRDKCKKLWLEINTSY